MRSERKGSLVAPARSTSRSHIAIPLTGAVVPRSTAASDAAVSDGESSTKPKRHSIKYPQEQQKIVSNQRGIRPLIPSREMATTELLLRCLEGTQVRRRRRCQQFSAPPHRTVKHAHQRPARTHRTMRSKYAPRRSSSSLRSACSTALASRCSRFFCPMMSACRCV